jgi:hypothetical protein
MFNMQDVKEYMRWADRAIADIARELDMDADAVRAVVEQWEAQRRNKEERDNPLAMRMQCLSWEHYAPAEPVIVTWPTTAATCAHEPPHSIGYFDNGYRCRKCGQWVEPIRLNVTADAIRPQTLSS